MEEAGQLTVLGWLIKGARGCHCFSPANSGKTAIFSLPSWVEVIVKILFAMAGGVGNNKVKVSGILPESLHVVSRRVANAVHCCGEVQLKPRGSKLLAASREVGIID